MIRIGLQSVHSYMNYGNRNVFWVRGSSNGSKHSITTTSTAAVWTTASRAIFLFSDPLWQERGGNFIFIYNHWNHIHGKMTRHVQCLMQFQLYSCVNALIIYKFNFLCMISAPFSERKPFKLTSSSLLPSC